MKQIDNNFVLKIGYDMTTISCHHHGFLVGNIYFTTDKYGNIGLITTGYYDVFGKIDGVDNI